VPRDQAAFLTGVQAALSPHDALLLGTDLVKDPAVLRMAYGDPAGVTAKFNLNILNRLNAELGADFEAGAFQHVVVWDERNEWIEMRLRAQNDQVVTLPDIGLSVRFTKGEEMGTEISAKFRRSGVEAELAAGRVGAAVVEDGRRRLVRRVAVSAAVRRRRGASRPPPC
jgi:L-histidine N-alpha-methyltransferase